MKPTTIENIILYNKILDFCREAAQCKYNIEFEFNIEPKRLGSMLTVLQKNKLIQAKKINFHRSVYSTVEGAIYKEKAIKSDAQILQNSDSNSDEKRKRKLNIIVEGNKTIVSINSYHTTAAITQKNEWRGYNSLGI